MFTGIVEAVAPIEAIRTLGNRVEVQVGVGERIAREVRVGDSVAIDGCCLTVVEVGERTLSFEAVPETLARTSLGERLAGECVNLERALRVDARLDGHLVQGHVDGIGRVHSLGRDGDDVRMRVSCDAEVGQLLVEKGSVTIDGVSLTVVEARPTAFSVALIPHTLSVTTLGGRKTGDAVNLEVDILGKYVHRYLERRLAGVSPPLFD